MAEEKISAEPVRWFDLAPEYAWMLVATAAAAVISLFVSFQMGVFVLVGAAVGWWCYLYPQRGFLLLLALMPILPMMKSTQVITTFTLIKDVIIMILFIRLVAVPFLKRKLPYRPNIMLAPLIALGGWLVVGFLRTDSWWLGVLRVREVVLYGLLFFVVLYLSHTWRRQKERLAWWLLIVVVTLWLGVYQWWLVPDSAVLRFDPVTEEWIPRLSSVMAHPSIFGQWLVVASTLLVPLVVLVKNWWWRLLFGFMLTACLWSVFLTYSRGVWIGLAAAVAAMGLVWLLSLSPFATPASSAIKAGLGERIRVFGFIVVVVVCLVALLRFTPAGGLLVSVVDPAYGSNEERLEFMVRLVSSMSEVEAVIGKGLGNVTAQQLREVDLTTAQIAAGDAGAVQETKSKTLVDNQYLKTWVEMGIVGLVLYGWLYWRAAAGAYMLAMARDWRSRALGLWAMGFLAAFVTQALFIDIWDVWPTNALFWIVAALVLAQNPRLNLRQVSVAQRRQ